CILLAILYNCIRHTYVEPTRKMRKLATALVLCLLPFLLEAQEIINLYNSPIPNSKVKAALETDPPLFRGMYRKSAFPTLQVFPADPEKSTGAAVIICPGGSYAVIVYEGE